jgi:fatty acid desaturase
MADAVSLARLKQRVHAELGDVTAPMPGRITAKLAALILADIAAMLVFVSADAWWWKAVAVLVGGWMHMAIGTTGHTASHNAVFRTAALNQAMTFVAYPLTLGLSATMWWTRHCKLHHPNPNGVGEDTDHDFMPLLAFRDEDLVGASRLQRAWFRVQWWFMPAIVATNAISVWLQGWWWILKHGLNKETREPAHAVDALCMALQPLLWIALPSIWFPISSLATFWLLRNLVLAYLMFAILGPGHLPGRAAIIDPGALKLNWVEKQAWTTVNFRVGPIGAALVSGLETQIEHHLFPTVPHPRYAQIRPIIKKYLEEHDLPYVELSWPRAIWEAWGAFGAPRRTCRTRADLHEHRAHPGAAPTSLPATSPPAAVEDDGALASGAA